ncbi:MAG TPA: hypothetical protein VHK27_05765 [Gammaproteobacteria bacterium]|nr:hypothetical protein [Gammaproteobacteria bacterium]
MAEYDSIIATAKRLIEKKGRAVQLTPPTTIDVDALKPWLGKQDGLGIPAFAAFTKDERTEEDGAQKRTGEAFLAADPAYNITTEFEVVDGEATWDITKADLIAPGMQQVVWRLDLAAGKT